MSITTTDGSKTLYTYFPEAAGAPGVAVVGAYQTLRSKTGVKFDLKRDTFVSKERRSDRMEAAMSYGNRQGSGSIPVEWSYGSYDPFLEAILGGTWATNVLKIGNTQRTFTFEETAQELGITEQMYGTQFTAFSISQKNNGIAEGSLDFIFRDIDANQTISGAAFTLAYAGTGPYTITRSVAGFITVDGWAVGNTVLGKGNVAPGNNNTTPWTITGLTDTVMTFTTATGFVAAGAANNITLNNGSVASAVSAASTIAPFDSFTGTITENGTVLAYVTGWDLKVENANQVNFVNGSPVAQSTSFGTCKVSGNLTVYYVDQSLRKKFLTGVATSLSLVMGSVALTKAYTFALGTVKYTSNNRDDNELARTESMGFSATYDVANASSLMITRTP